MRLVYYNEKNERKFTGEILFNNCTLAMRIEFAKFFGASENDKKQLIKLSSIISETTDRSEMGLTKALFDAKDKGLLTDAEILELNKNIKTSDDIINENYRLIDIFKKMINTNELKEDIKELINSDSKSAFWAEQDIIAIEDAVSSFRKKIGV